MKKLILLLLIFPNLVFARFTYNEIPDSSQILKELRIFAYTWGSKDWDQMRESTDVSVEEYYLYAVSRCGGFFHAKTTLENVDNLLLVKKALSFDKTIENIIKREHDDYIRVKKETLAYQNKQMYKNYYLDIFQSNRLFNSSNTSIKTDTQICERYF